MLADPSHYLCTCGAAQQLDMRQRPSLQCFGCSISKDIDQHQLEIDQAQRMRVVFAASKLRIRVLSQLFC